MINIDQILIINDPQNSMDDFGELTFDEVREFGEEFYDEGFHAEVYFTDGSSFSCFKTNAGWDIIELQDDDEDDEYLSQFITEEESDEDINLKKDKDGNISSINIGEIFIAKLGINKNTPVTFEELLNFLLDELNARSASQNLN